MHVPLLRRSRASVNGAANKRSEDERMSTGLKRNARGTYLLPGLTFRRVGRRYPLCQDAVGRDYPGGFGHREPKVPAKTTLWKLDPHTAAKHRLLRSYLDAWLPIMGRSGHPSVLLVDGFAGPGRYASGEPGSPLIFLDAFLSHRDRPNWDATEFKFVFVEKEQDRFDHLRSELDQIVLPANAKVFPVPGEFHVAMKELLDSVPHGFGLPPSFVFIDPFGWTGHGLDLSSRILGFRRCEVLLYVPLPWIARFVTDDKVSGSFDNLFGDDSWRAARALDDGQERLALLHDVILDKVRSMGRHARSFQIEAGGRGWNGYHLFFGTQNEKGLDKMKYAMWQVDPVAGIRFADSTDNGQLTLFEDRPDLTPLQDALRAHFGTRRFAIEEAEQFTLLETPYHPSIHLKRGALVPLEADGRLGATQRLRARTYPKGTILRFNRQPGGPPFGRGTRSLVPRPTV